MNENINFYDFMHKQIMVVVFLFVTTAPGYILMGYIHSSTDFEVTWFSMIIVVSLFGVILYREYMPLLPIEEKDKWLNKVRFFMFVYFSLWTIMFVNYVLKSDISMHYIAIATQLGTVVVASTILASQKKLVISIVVTSMLPLTIYLILVGELYSYILSFFSIVLAFVLLYAAKNTHEHLLKSRYQAYHDHLTGLGNRRFFLEMLSSITQRKDSTYAYILLIDLDHFKTINDTLGHDIGDELLTEVSARMNQECRKNKSTIYRLGGDEFCILSRSFQSDSQALEEAELFATTLLRQIKNNYNLDGNHLYISASIGVSIIKPEAMKTTDFLKEADMAMYEAKKSGRDGVIIFNDELCAVVDEKLAIEKELHFALENNEIFLNYQPQVDANKKIVGCEVLVRWKSKKLGFIGPDTFIPIAENTGYIVELGEYILEESFKTLQEWSKKGVDLQTFSINLSMRQILNQDFINLVDTLIKKYIPRKNKIHIIFEITETSAADDLDNLIAIIKVLKQYNISFSMDDFGTGYSSLSYLRKMPISEIKIDKSFISELSDIQQASLVKTIVDISKNLNLTIVAEGVEEEYQRDFLLELDCDLFQGYLFSKPVCKSDFEKLIL